MQESFESLRLSSNLSCTNLGGRGFCCDFSFLRDRLRLFLLHFLLRLFLTKTSFGCSNCSLTEHFSTFTDGELGEGLVICFEEDALEGERLRLILGGDSKGGDGSSGCSSESQRSVAGFVVCCCVFDVTVTFKME